MNPKRILFVGWLFYPKVGGAETILLNQARELVRRGHHVSVLTSVLSDAAENEKYIFGIRVFRRKYIDSRNPIDKPTACADLSKIISQLKPDLIHFHNGSYPSGSADKSIGVDNILTIFSHLLGFSLPIVEHAHNAQLKDPEITKPLRDLPWNHLICVSNFVKNEWLKLGTNAKKISTVYNGIDVKKFSSALPSPVMQKFRTLPDQTILFSPARLFSLTTGNLNKQKNLRLVFDALGHLATKGITNYQFVSIFNEVYGNEVVAAAKSSLDTQLSKTGVKSNVSFIDTIDPDDMPEYYAGSDIVCVPSLYETFGLMYLEAMATGKVVISSNTGGPTEYIKDNYNGFLVDPQNPEALAGLLEKLMSDTSLQRRIGQQAAKDAQKYTTDSMTDALEEIYDRLC